MMPVCSPASPRHCGRRATGDRIRQRERTHRQGNDDGPRRVRLPGVPRHCARAATHMKPRLFLSSTFADLHFERGMVLRAASDAGWEPVHFETITTFTPPEVITRVHRDIRSCQAFLSLLGSRYGSRVPGLAVSYTHFEFALARRLGKPIVSLVRTGPEAQDQARGWRTSYPIPDAELRTLREQIRLAEADGACLRREWAGSSLDFRGVAESALRDGLRRYSAGEFRPGSLAVADEGKEPAASRRGGVWEWAPRFANRLNLSAKREPTRYFWDYNLPLAAAGEELSMYFGAGATSCHGLHTLVEALRWTQLYGRPPVRVVTNNFIVASDLTDGLRDMNCEVHLAPGRFDPKYAAVRFDGSSEGFSHHLDMIGPGRGGALFIGGLSAPAPHHQTRLESSEGFELLRAVSGRRRVGGVLFLDMTGTADGVFEDRLSSFLGGGGRAVPVALCVGTASVAQRDVAARCLEVAGFAPVHPTYAAADFRGHFPVVATSVTFRDTFGLVIG